MEATVLSVGKSVLDGALGYAKSALAEEVALQLGVRRDQVFITNELEMMKAFLESAHDEGADDKVVKVWVKQVRDVAYNVEDCLQDFAVRLNKQSWWRIRRRLLDRRRVAKQMKELRANVEDVSQRNMRYNLIKSSGSKSATAAHQSAIAGATMSGIEEARQQRDKATMDLVRLINRKDNNLRVVAVSGTGSSHLEETSIIKRAYEDPKIHKKFECRAWIGGLMCPFNLIEFLRTIIEQFLINFLQEAKEKEKTTLEIQVLRKMRKISGDDFVDQFTRYVTNKSYLIVLNGIHDIEEWDQIKPCFRNNKKGSRIILSAEQLGVACLCAGPEDAALNYKQLFVDQNIYAFYEKVSQDETDSTEAGSSSNTATAGIDSSANRKMLGCTETILAAFKESQLIGRQKEKSDIIELITKKDRQQLEVICVWGMGGLGKTTLVTDVYRSQELSGKFEKRACVTILRPFNVDKLLKDLATQLGCGAANMVRDLEGKKYLIVIDDVLSNAEWDFIKPHFPANETSSRIIVTTRVNRIAMHCSNKKLDNIYELPSLRPDNARELFEEKVFGKTTNLDEQDRELVAQANLILKKCNGLPLAIAAIGGFLANQPKSALKWRKLNENISAELVLNSELEIIRTVLMKSYDGLPYYLKSCFLYLSIFPEDHKISLKRLLLRWIAEGYTTVVRNKSAEEIAESYLMELISRSMLLPIQKSSYSRKGIDSYQVHDMIREIGISKSMEENLVFRLEGGCSLSNTQDIAARHLAINDNWEGDQSEFESMVDMSRVRSLTVFGKWKSFFISEKMSLLRVLDLEDTSDLVDHHLKHIGKLLHLRYLSLRGCDDIYHLPDSLGNLRQLETLDIRGTCIVMLPKTIIKLHKLKSFRAGEVPVDHEDVSCQEYVGGILPKIPAMTGSRPCILPMISMLTCLFWCAPQLLDEDGYMNRRDVYTMFCWFLFPVVAMRLDRHGVLVPRGMKKLKALHTLGVVYIGKWGKAVLQDIKGLVQLRKLAVTGVNKENGQELCSAIVGLRRLESLSIRSEGKPGLFGCLDGKFSFPVKLQSLKLYGNLVKLPEWVQGLKHLVKLKLTFSRISEPDAAIQVLGGLPKLAFLHFLNKSFKGEEVRLNFPPEMFPSLIVLALGLESGFRSIKFEQGATPKLELLKFCRVDIDSDSLSGLASLSGLKEVVLQGTFAPSELEHARAAVAENTNRPVVKRV